MRSPPGPHPEPVALPERRRSGEEFGGEVRTSLLPQSSLGPVPRSREWQEIAALALLVEGFLLAPSLHGCVSTATTDDHIEAFLAAFADLLDR